MFSMAPPRPSRDWCSRTRGAVRPPSPRAGPCLVVMPRLIRVARGYGGRVPLVMINTDECGELGRRLEVRALPMLQLSRHGVAIACRQGVKSEGALRAFLDPYVASTDPILAAHVQQIS